MITAYNNALFFQKILFLRMSHMYIISVMELPSQSSLLTEASKVRESLQKTVLDAYRDEYKELSDTWRSLESKAQGNVAIGGIFIAAAFAYMRDINMQMHLHEKILLGLTLLCLVSSIIFSIFALRIRRVSAPPFGEFVNRLVSDLLQVADAELSERMSGFLYDQSIAWQKLRREVTELNRLKARHLWRGQLSLLTAIVTVAVITLSRIFG